MFSISNVNEGWGRYFPWLNEVDSIAFGPENIPPPPLCWQSQVKSSVTGLYLKSADSYRDFSSISFIWVVALKY